MIFIFNKEHVYKIVNECDVFSSWTCRPFIFHLREEVSGLLANVADLISVRKADIIGVPKYVVLAHVFCCFQFKQGTESFRTGVFLR